MRGPLRPRYLLLPILLCVLAVSVLDLDYNSVFADEAAHILVGQQLLRSEPCPNCPFVTGSQWIHPLTAAVGDSIGGLRGARGVNILFGLVLTVIVFATAALLFSEVSGVIAATLFAFSSQTLYLMKLATYDMIAAFWLGLGFLLIVLSERAVTTARQNLWLVSAACVLFLACVTKYLVPFCVLPLLVYVVWRRGFSRTLVFCFLPLALLAVAYYFIAIQPVQDALYGTMAASRGASRESLINLLEWSLRWIAIPLLLAVFALSRPQRRSMILWLLVFSLPLLVLHLATRAEQSLNKNMLFVLVFLAPAAGLGLERAGSLIASRSATPALRPFLIVAALVFSAAFGFRGLSWLERQYPDLGPVFSYLERNGHDGMTVAWNGWDNGVFTYSLGASFPAARFVLIGRGYTGGESGGGESRSEHVRPDAGRIAHPLAGVDYVVCEDFFYGSGAPCDAFATELESRFRLLAEYEISLSWGTAPARIFGKR